MTGRPESGSNFQLGFLFLAREKREALREVYGFCRRVDDIVDSGSLPPPEAAKELDFWVGEIERLYGGTPTHPLSLRLLPHVREYRLPKEGFLSLLAGVRMDLEKSRYETFEELEKYLYGVAGSVGLLCVEIFGYRHTPVAEVREYALSMGNAFQLTNILRDVGSDMERGRIYLPQEDFRAAGCGMDSFLRRQHTPEFLRLMGLQYDRAKGFYRKARNLLHPLDRAAMTPAEVMAAIYEELLDTMKSGQFRVFFTRTRLPLWRKAALACKAWAASHGIY
ncbi:MAG: squalene/phytoene synthase family protein [Elusimicrobiota bacterium]